MSQKHQIVRARQSGVIVGFFDVMTKFVLAFSEKLRYNINVALHHAGVMELVDVVDSKSTDGDIVPVRVRPPAPLAIVL